MNRERPVTGRAAGGLDSAVEGEGQGVSGACRTAVEVWQGLCDPQRHELPRSAPDPVGASVRPPVWWSGFLDEDGDPDPHYVMPVHEHPDDRHWGSTTACVPLTLYRGTAAWRSRGGEPDARVVLATAEVRLGQDVDHREPFVHLGRRAYVHDHGGREGQDYRQVLDLRLCEAEDLAHVLLAAVRLARAEQVVGQVSS